MRALGVLDPSEAVASQHIEAAMTAHFEIVRKWPRGGTLLAPIFGSGCLDPAMADSPGGLAILAAMFEAEQDLIRDGALPSDSYVYIAKPRPSACALAREAFECHAGPVLITQSTCADQRSVALCRPSHSPLKVERTVDELRARRPLSSS